jgi:hypothetical protein
VAQEDERVIAELEQQFAPTSSTPSSRRPTFFWRVIDAIVASGYADGLGPVLPPPQLQPPDSYDQRRP